MHVTSQNSHIKAVKSVYTLIKPDPQKRLPLFFDSPHSGRIYPEDFHYDCDFKMLQSGEDRWVDHLFDNAPSFGAAFLKAEFPRTYIDLNRAEDDIDPEILEEPWPEEMNPSPRSMAGVGLIRRLIKPGVSIYDQKLKIQEIQRRIEDFYQPYHQQILHEMNEIHNIFGLICHINCHSMPSAPRFRSKMNPANLIKPTMPQSDFILGDRDGTTCDPDFVRAMRDFLKSLGYSVTINEVYKGAEIIKRHSCPARGRYSVQIEVNRKLYMNEEILEKSNNFENLKLDLEKLMGFCADYVRAQLVPLAAD